MVTQILWYDTDTAAQIAALGGQDAVEEAVARVLPERRVLLQCLTGGISGATVFRASPVWIEGGAERHEVEGVVKIGRAAELALEVGNYDTRVKNVLLEQTDYAMLDYPSEIFEVAKRDPDAIVAINYRRVGRTTFGRYIADCIESGAVGAACDAIDRVLVILRPWQEMMHVETAKSLAADGVYGFKDMTSFEQLRAECERLEGPHIGQDAHWSRRVASLWTTLAPQRTLETALHGDLHTENIMVGVDGQVTLIDFAACTDGHFLRDVCTLEAHLLMRALVPKGEGELELYLAGITRLYERGFLLNPFRDSASTPIQAVVARLRRYAYASLMNGNAEYAAQYAFAVLRHAIRVAIRTGDATTDNERHAALTVCRLLSDSLTVADGGLEIAPVPKALPVLGFLDGREGRWFDEDGVSPPIASMCTAETWEGLAAEIMAARSVDLFGLVPVTLLNEMLKRAEETASQKRAMYLHYVTTVPAGRENVGLAYAHPRWRGSLTGVRNLVRVLGGRANSLQFQGSIFMSTRVSENCVIRLERQNGNTRVLEVTRLSEAVEDRPGAFSLNQIADDDGRWSNWFQETLSSASAIILRQVVCESEPDPLDGGVYDFRPLRPKALATYGDPHPGAGLMPIALTILRSDGAMGTRVLMKNRNWLTDNDTFNRYSFMSTRILAEDLARAKDKSHMPRPSEADEWECLWEMIDQPRPWTLEQKVFVTAAQRDVYACTLLDLPQDRFDLKGMHLLSQDESDVQNCFIVFLVEMDREEVAWAQRSSEGMLEGVIRTLELVTPEQIFNGSLPVNRFTVQRSEWLQDILK